ncbi:hypothetical protein [Sanyastnella coralliicola]|uniref:hypothetical protein n=1 Tax=Sanyastnella coralliicola TaxID=3069118 RepID=UPI0027B9CD6A|nr:hypothetical protein [Longitalea sp. SCSIO 12813]
MKKVRIMVFSLVMSMAFAALAFNNEQPAVHPSNEKVHDTNFQISLPEGPVESILILFGGYGQKPSDVLLAFPIESKLRDQNIAVIYVKQLNRIWLNEDELNSIQESIAQTRASHKLSTKKLFLGGFSSGGNHALQFANQLSSQGDDQVLGVFTVDNPIDLEQLYLNAEENIERNFHPWAIGESLMITQTINDSIGNGNRDEFFNDFSLYRRSSNAHLLEDLKSTSLRFYTEPDTAWHRENRGTNYEDINAYQLEGLTSLLRSEGFDVQMITTTGKGYRPDGMRHPHSWSIVDQEELVKWFLSLNRRK